MQPRTRSPEPVHADPNAQSNQEVPMRKRYLAIVAGLALGSAAASPAQTATGHIYGTVTDPSQAVLSGAAVALSGATIGARSTVTDRIGEFRFLSLDPGTYKLAVSMPGLTTVSRDLIVQTGVSVEVTIVLEVPKLEEIVFVNASTPVVDRKKLGTATNVSRDELERVPQARDPWAVLRTVPGVLMDRVNIAGNESGQQAAFVAKGAGGWQTVWNIDGLPITDMHAAGFSSAYYDYDAFSEIKVSTGGHEIRAATGGVNLNLVTRRGTNAFHGGGRFYFTHDDLQSSNLPAELVNDPRLENEDGSFRDKADHIRQIADYGGDLGGPLVKDKLWFYGSYGVQDIRLVRLSGTPDKTLLRSYNAKLNWQPGPSDAVSLFWFRGHKIKEGRSVGTGLQEADSFLYNQDDARRENTPPGLYKLEWSHVFGPSLFLNAKAAYFGTGFGLKPRGGLDQPGTLDYTNGTAIGSSWQYLALRPQTTLALEGNYFRAGLGGNHELKFGFGYRRTPEDSTTQYAGRMWGLIDRDIRLVNIYRDRVASFESRYRHAYLSDTFTRGRLTINLGLRLDRQTANNRPSETPANPDFPELLPAIQFDGRGAGVEWNDLSPRVGLSYALDEARRTVVRASYARYAGQLGTGEGAFDSPLGTISYLQYYWDDRNRDRLPQKEEVLTDAGLFYAYNVDPADPGSVSSSNKIDPAYHAPHDWEALLGFERELLPNLAVGMAYTYRKTSDFAPWLARNGVTRQDYTRSVTVTEVTPLGEFTATAFGADPAKVQPGRTLVNQLDHHLRFSGIELTLHKRLADRWMARLAFSYNDWIERFEGGVEGSRGVQDPTRLDFIDIFTATGPLVDGGQVAHGGHFSSVRWQLTGSGLYELPWGLEVSAAVFARQGHPRPTFLVMRIPGERPKGVLAEARVDTRRYPDLWNVDLRVAKNIRVGGATLALSAEVFNVFNSGVELARTLDASSDVFNRLDEILNPQIARFGVRVMF
jgi:hypothetical protein